MNAARRKEIAKAVGLLEEAQAILESVASEERDYLDNMPDNMRGGDKGSKAEEDANTLEEAEQAVTEIVGNLGNIE